MSYHYWLLFVLLLCVAVLCLVWLGCAVCLNDMLLEPARCYCMTLYLGTRSARSLILTLLNDRKQLWVYSKPCYIIIYTIREEDVCGWRIIRKYTNTKTYLSLMPLFFSADHLLVVLSLANCLFSPSSISLL